jgi:hypothetical protein
MKTKYRLDFAFGPVGSTAGIFIFCAGIGIIYFSLIGLVCILLGSFIGFTTSASVVDFESKKIKYGNNLFGIINTGKWIEINESMSLGIRQQKRAWRAYSMSNRSIDVAENNFRIILFDKNREKIVPILKSKSLGIAEEELVKLTSKLGLKRI